MVKNFNKRKIGLPSLISWMLTIYGAVWWRLDLMTIPSIARSTHFHSNIPIHLHGYGTTRWVSRMWCVILSIYCTVMCRVLLHHGSGIITKVMGSWVLVLSHHVIRYFLSGITLPLRRRRTPWNWALFSILADEILQVPDVVDSDAEGFELWQSLVAIFVRNEFS